jgi:purine-binding chemotaxis protein CheW
MTLADESNRFLVCRIGSHIGALALQHVRETMRPLPVQPVSGAPAFVLGLAVVRGAPAPVVDTCRLLDPSVSCSVLSPARFVSIMLGERCAVLAVDAVLEVRSFARGAMAEIPPLLRGAGTGIISAIGALDAELLLVLEAARLIPQAVWSAVEASGISA